MNRELLDILDRCIADVRSGRTSIERCLEEYPAHRAELADLLPAATAIVPLPLHVAPDPARTMRARYALVEAMHRDAQPTGSGFFGGLAGLRRGLAGIAAAAALALGGTGAAVVAAQDAQPNDPLYGLKTAVEQQQVAFAASPEARAYLRVQIAQRRLAEAQRAIEAGRDDAAVAAAAAYGETMERAYDDIHAAQAAGASATGADDAADDSLARLQDVAARASTVGNRPAAAALTAAAERAERERASRERPRPQGEPPARQAEAARPVDNVEDLQPTAFAAEEPLEESSALVSLGAPSDGEAAPAASPPLTVAAAPPARAATAAPAARGEPQVNGNGQGNASQEQRGAGVRGDNANDEARGDRGDRGDDGNRGGDGGQRSGSSQRAPSTPQTSVSAAPTETPTRRDAQRVERDGSGERGGDGGRGDDDRERSSPTQTPVVAPRTGSAAEERRGTPTPTPTLRPGSGDDDGRDGATPIPGRSRSGSNGGDEGGRDENHAGNRG